MLFSFFCIEAKNESMFYSISWQDFLIGAAIMLSIYYFLLIALFFRRELRHISQNCIQLQKLFPLKFFVKKAKNNKAVANAYHINTDKVDELKLAAQMLEELLAIINQLALVHPAKTELITSLQRVFSDYRPLDNLFLLQIINSSIIKACKDKCSIHLSEGDIGELYGKPVGGASFEKSFDGIDLNNN